VEAEDHCGISDKGRHFSGGVKQIWQAQALTLPGRA
jgi:hypothetical protein